MSERWQERIWMLLFAIVVVTAIAALVGAFWFSSVRLLILALVLGLIIWMVLK